MDNRTDFSFYRKATDSAKGKQGRSAPSTYFGAFRMFARDFNTILRKDYDQMIEEYNSKSEVYNAKKLQELKLEQEETFRAETKGKQDILNRTLDKLINFKKESITKFTMIPPSPEHIAMIDLADKRFDSITETEWLMLVQLVAANYQESAYLNSIAVKHGKDYAIPYEPEKAFSDLDELQARMQTEVISRIAEDPNSVPSMSQFFRYEDGSTVYGRINELCKYFDDLPITLVEKPILELTEENDFNNRLLNARRTCWEHNMKSLWDECASLILEIQKDGLNPDNLARGEQMIKVVSELFPDSGADEQ